ncbi:MAG: tetratricopeptide repeat protein [Nitrospira sp.]|nr:tetratricopeptide repeat protein [Nitrospira sp.]MDH4242652.1 tetratricopeptide repeat protein [Nitrospira sp.]MDH4355227.1 tetratricopeptide repeat protein [Nitrospira sp.]MDH5318540.1 tetratricopeptide repeat protein [Nitrospira sp.]
MKQISMVLIVLLAGFVPILASCDGNKPAIPTAQTKAAEAVPEPETALMAAADSPGQADNNEAVSQYQQGKIEVAIEGFQKAIKADPKSAEAQYNLGLSFDRMGKHDEAKEAFKEATALSPTNPAIKESAILKKHTS